MAEGIDADVVLGVAAKASQVFAEEDAFLSYPLAPIGFRQEELEAMAAGSTAEGLRALAEFSYLVNAIPAGPLWSVLQSGYLWDVYGDVIATAQLAASVWTKDEKKAYGKAYRFLHEVRPDGSVVDSPALLRYRQYRDAWLVVAEQHRAQADPVLRERQAEIEREWAVEGRRAEVEEAQRIEAQLSQRSPAEAWARYRKLFDPSTPDLFFATGVDGGKFVPTLFRPSSALAGSWPRISLTREELKALAADAPAELRARLGDSADSGVRVLSFEYTSVAISRSWFAPEVFGSRAWRFRDGAKSISDGAADDPRGRCPAYVTGLVLFRNLSVSRETAAGPPPVEPDMGPLHLGALDELAPLQLRDDAFTLVGPVAATVAGAGAVDPGAQVEVATPELMGALRVADFRRIDLVLPTPEAQPEPAPPPGGSLQTTTTPPGDVYVLAFVCERVPRSPDPDPALRWPGDKGPRWPGRFLKQPPAMKGEDVRKWQAQMKARGWSVAVDGSYDKRDEEKCRAFQAEKGLESDGEVGPETWRATWNAPVT